MAAAIVSATRKNTTVQGTINLKGLARLIELSKRTPPIISEIIVMGGQIGIDDPNHAKKDYFINPWLEIVATVEDWKNNLQYDRANKVVTIDKTVNLF